MDEFEEGLRARLHTAADEVRRATPLADPAPALRRGLLLRRLHIASLAGTAAAAALIMIFIASQLPTAATRPPDSAGLLSLLPLPTEVASLLPSPTTTTKPSPTATPTPKPSPSVRPSGSPSPAPTWSPPLDGCAPYPPADPPAGIDVSLNMLKKTFARGEPVTLSMVVQNAGVAPVTHWRPSSQRYDFWVMRGRTVVWKWSDGKVFTQALEQETFGPGEKREATEAWNQTQCGGIESQLQPGKYVAFGQWTTTTEDGARGWWSNPVEFEIL